MSLRERLVQRSSRGNPIGPDAMLSRLDAALAGRRRSLAVVHPGFGFVAAAVATLVLVGGVLFAFRPSSGSSPVVDTSTTTTTTPAPVTTTTAPPDEHTTSTTLAGPDQRSEALPLLAFLRGQVVDLRSVPAPEIGRFDGNSYQDHPPVEVGNGWLLAVVNDQGRGVMQLLDPETGELVDVAEDVGNAAVAGDLTTVAYAQYIGAIGTAGAQTRLVIAELPGGDVVDETTLDGFARVEGWASGVVFLEVGDGAAAGAATWVPGSATIVPIPGYGGVAATAPNDGLALLHQGDGPCPILVTVTGDGSVAPTDGGYAASLADCWLGWGPAFSPDASRIAFSGFEKEEGGYYVGENPAIVVVVSADDGETLQTIEIEGMTERFFQPLQIVWLSSDSLVVFAESWSARSSGDPLSGTRGLYRCYLAEDRCSLARVLDIEPDGYNQVAVAAIP